MMLLRYMAYFLHILLNQMTLVLLGLPQGLLRWSIALGSKSKQPHRDSKQNYQICCPSHIQLRLGIPMLRLRLQPDVMPNRLVQDGFTPVILELRICQADHILQ
jgi:hypothetical protein